MLKKFKQQNDLEFYQFHNYLEGPIFFYGKVGSGKSVSMLTISQLYYSYGYKIWDLDGGPRNENIYYTLPSIDKIYWAKFNKIGIFDEEGPKQYKINILYPYFKSKFPKDKKLLLKKINGEIVVKSIPFTIPLKTVTKDDIAMVVGALSETSKYAWNELQFKATKKDNAGSLIQLSKSIKGISNTPIYKNFIIPMYREEFISSNYQDYNLDIIAEAKDTRTITILSLEFVPKEFHLFVLNWISRNINEYLDKNKIPKKNIIMIREAARYFRAGDDAIIEDRFKLFRSYISDYIRMGRRGAYYLLDCQSPAETKGITQGSDDFTLMFRITSPRDKRELTDELIREKRMRINQVADLAFLEKGQCYVCESGNRTVRKVQIRLPRTMYWRKEYGNFYKNVWERFGGEWKNEEEFEDYINKSNKEREKFYKSKDEDTENLPEEVITKPIKQEMPIINSSIEEVKEIDKKKEEIVEQNIINNNINKPKKVIRIKRSIFR